MSAMAEETGKKIMWKDRKRTLFGLPWSFTKYSLTEEKLYLSRGFFTSTEDEIRLYRVLDLTLRRTLGEKLWGLGTIHV
ncbi:MAG: PH domain-containing protein, partial [Clostridiales bacterium]|nr:PH domain-containing protein [Clostridiales bacterium]